MDFPLEHVAGITGTNGKTKMITYLVESILRNSGKQAGVIGTNFLIQRPCIKSGKYNARGVAAKFIAS